MAIRNVQAGNGIEIGEDAYVNIAATARLGIVDIAQNGIQSATDFDNQGKIILQNIGGNGVHNTGTFNNAGGSISFRNVDMNAILCIDEGEWFNDGAISINAAHDGINLQNGFFQNNSESSIHIANTSFSGILVNHFPVPSQFINQGEIEVQLPEGLFNGGTHGIFNAGDFENSQTASITIHNPEAESILNRENAHFNNSGAVYLRNYTLYENRAIKNHGEFTNGICARLELDGRVANQTTGTITNNGFIYSNYLGPNTISYNFGTFINNGVIEDNPGILGPIVGDNNKIITSAINDTARVGIPYSDFLEIGNWDNFFVRGCYTSPEVNVSAGLYNAQTNVWTPNSAAQGLDEVFLSITYSGQDARCNSLIKVQITDGVWGPSPFGPSAGGQLSAVIEEDEKVVVYPNPSNGEFHFKMKEALSGNFQIQIQDISGRIHLQKEQYLEQEQEIFVSASRKLENGMYQLLLLKEGALVASERFTVIKN